MKQKDLILIIVIVFISSIISLVVSKTIFGGAKAVQSAEVVEPITSEFKKPNPKYFNDKAFDPTLIIKIGTSNSADPFSGTSKP